jgi:hypothetical protein
MGTLCNNNFGVHSLIVTKVPLWWGMLIVVEVVGVCACTRVCVCVCVYVVAGTMWELCTLCLILLWTCNCS